MKSSLKRFSLLLALLAVRRADAGRLPERACRCAC